MHTKNTAAPVHFPKCKSSGILLRRFRFLLQRFVHISHQNQDHQQIIRKNRDRSVVCDHTEQRRHQAVANIGAGHLNPNDRLRPVRTEAARRCMNDTGIDRSTAKTNQQQPCQCHCFPKRQKKRRYPNRDDPLPHTNHLGIIEFQGQEAAQSPPHGDADKEKTGKAGGGLRRDSPVQHQITAGPQTGGLLQRAVAKKM